MAARQFIYHMRIYPKTYPAGKKGLDNVDLSSTRTRRSAFFASTVRQVTLMHIMAGLDTIHRRRLRRRGREGRLPAQEPELDPALNIKGNAMLGVKEKQAILDRTTISR